MNVKQALIGKTVTAVEVSEDRETITFQTTTGPITLRAYGDWCSTTWVEDLDDPQALLGTITDVEHLDMPDLGNIAGKYRSDVDEVAYYGMKITTEHGRCTIDYRNDSNGYYGGSLEVVEAA